MSKQSQKKKILHSHLNAYSATAIASLAAAPALHAEITNITSFVENGTATTNVSLRLAAHNSLTFEADFGKNEILKFIGEVGGGTSYFGRSTYAKIKALAGGVATHPATKALNLGAGSALVGRAFRSNLSVLLAKKTTHGKSTAGNFLPAGHGAAKTGYVDFKFKNVNGTTNYGWLRVQVRNGGNGYPSQVNLLSKSGSPTIYGAFDSKADITADGFTAGSVAAVPEPPVETLAGLGLLALGTAGLREMRRRKAAV